MDEGKGTPKWAWVVGALVVIVGAWRLVSCARRGETVDVGVVCTSCDFHGPTKVAVGSVDWPIKCPKCRKRTAYVASLCPKCGKPIPTDPKSPPTSCPHCQAALGAAGQEGP